MIQVSGLRPGKLCFQGILYAVYCFQGIKVENPPTTLAKSCIDQLRKYVTFTDFVYPIEIDKLKLVKQINEYLYLFPVFKINYGFDAFNKTLYKICKYTNDHSLKWSYSLGM